MNNKDISKIFADIADLLELKGESRFRVIAYQRAARSIELSPIEMDQLAEEGRLLEVPAVGESIAQKILELLRTGRCQYYDDLRAEFPEGMVSLTEIPNVGPKTAVRLVRELGVANPEQLEQAILDGRVAALPRLGQKSADNILHALQTLRTKERRILLGQAVPLAEEMIAALSGVPGVHNIVAAGSLRRWKETIGDIDLMGTAADPERVTRAFTELPVVKEVLMQGPTKASVLVRGDLQVDLRIVEDERFGSLLQHFTGSKEHNVLLRERGVKAGLKLSEYGIAVRGESFLGRTEAIASEEEFYQRLGLQYIPPELREAHGEIEAAERGEIPRLVEVADIRGDLHAHTDWSDGHHSLEEMAQAALAKGYQYLAVSDHSGGRGIAHGLTEERLREQMALIAEFNQKTSGLRLLAATEVDIRADGSLDFPDELLAELDVVTASVHSAMGQDEATMTRRIIKAIENPNVDIIGHPTCRLLPNREPVAVDMEAVLRAARDHDKALEINAEPHRLDLKDTHAYRARELGVKLVICTDAHSTEQLDFMRFGVAVARRAWCQSDHILNTQPWAKVETWLKSHRRD